MEIKSINITPIYIDQIAQEIKIRVEANEYNKEHADTKYDYGYIDGYHDALIEILNYLGVEHDQEYYCQ